MPSYVWCDRACYTVSQSPEEIASLIDDPTRDPRYRASRFIRLDQVLHDHNTGEYKHPRPVALRIGAISAYGPDKA